MVRFLSAAEGGRPSPVNSGYRAQVVFYDAAGAAVEQISLGLIGTLKLSRTERRLGRVSKAPALEVAASILHREHGIRKPAWVGHERSRKTARHP